MKHHLAGIVAVSALACGAAMGQTQPAASTHPSGAIAAYMQIVKDLQSAPDSGLLEAAPYPYDPISPVVVAVLERNNTALDRTRAVADLPAGQWGGMTTPESLKALLKDLGKLRTISQAVMTRARWHNDAKRPAAAASDMLSALAMGRHISQQPLLVTRMAGAGMENNATAMTAHLLQSWPADVVKEFEAGLLRLPAAPSFQNTLRGELEFGNQLAEGEKLPKEMVDGLAEFYGTVIQSKAFTAEEFEDVMEKAIEKLPEEKRALALTIVPPIGSARRSLSRVDAFTAMLQTALRIQVEGESAVAKSKDPFGDGPFTYVKTADGYELHGRLRAGGKKQEALKLEVTPKIVP